MYTIESFAIKGYVGCFNNCNSPGPLRQLTGLTQAMATSQGAGALDMTYFILSNTMMTVEYCQDFCYALNFMYAGLDTG